ncbi:MAG: DUF692 domain-containing protein [Myxococcota bacterium]|jgi:uncharacterized protein|nr:DUF692 domain-containing protein [Myxococcota bacterium]
MTGVEESRAIHGVGLGLRSRHYDELLAGVGEIPWLEVLLDNYAHGDGLPMHQLELIAEDYPLVFHGVGMSLGSADPLDVRYLDAVMGLVDRFEPAWLSEHLAWTSSGGRHHHELLPLPFNDEAVDTLVARIGQVQDRLGGPMLVENSSGYTAFKASAMSELEFVGRVLESADCLLLLDINNLYVNAWNHNFDALEFLRGLPRERVAQMHLAGHDHREHYLVDAHGSPVVEPVWELYAEAVRLFPDIPVCVEWDRDVPALDLLLGEVKKARDIMAGGQVGSGGEESDAS